jgi:transcriptional regulator with XRE-family HTH domain
MDIGSRLKKAILLNYKTLKEFSKKTGIPYITLHRYFSGKRKLNVDVLNDMNRYLNISIDWLLTGKGQMYLNEKTENKEYPKWLTDWWQQSNEEHRNWLKIQLKNTK